MSAAPGRSQASSHRSAQHEGTPVSAAPGRSQASSHRSAQHEGISVGVVLPPLQALRHAASLPEANFRLAMRRLVGAVSIVTSSDGQTPVGLTATAVTAFSSEPARLLTCINLKGTTFRAIAENRRMAVNVLALHHTELAKSFGGAPLSHDERFSRAQWSTLVTGAPVLLDALAVFDCVVDEMMVAHSHAVMIGEIKSVLLSPLQAPPLLYADGNFTTIAQQLAGQSTALKAA